jgi:hypothetical protein
MVCGFLVDPLLQSDIIVVESLFNTILDQFPSTVWESQESVQSLCSLLYRKGFSTYHYHLLEVIRHTPLIPVSKSKHDKGRVFRSNLAFYVVQQLLNISIPPSTSSVFPNPNSVVELFQATIEKICKLPVQDDLDFQELYSIIALLDNSLDKPLLSSLTESNVRSTIQQKLSELSRCIPDSGVMHLGRSRVSELNTF